MNHNQFTLAMTGLWLSFTALLYIATLIYYSNRNKR